MFFYLVSFVSVILSLFIAMRWTIALGINDLVFLVLTGVVTETFGLAFSQLPILILFAKLTPKHVEASFYALLTGLFNMCNTVIAPMMGVFIN